MLSQLKLCKSFPTASLISTLSQGLCSWSQFMASQKKSRKQKKEFVYAGRARVRPTDSRAGNIKSPLCACLTINARSTVGTSFDMTRCLFTLLKPYTFILEKCLVPLISSVVYNRGLNLANNRAYSYLSLCKWQQIETKT